MQTQMNCHIMGHSVWVFTFCQRTCLLESRIKRFNPLYMDGFFHLVWFNTLGMLHYRARGNRLLPFFYWILKSQTEQELGCNKAFSIPPQSLCSSLNLLKALIDQDWPTGWKQYTPPPLKLCFAGGIIIKLLIIRFQSQIFPHPALISFIL